MMGSGFLQILEIFSTIEYIESHVDGICLILIDEPDSHIHSDLQSYLIDELKNHADSQILVISHNDRLVSKVDEGELFYLNSAVKELGKLDPLLISDFQKVKAGLASVLEELSAEDARTIILTEGKSDKKILDTAWDKLNPGMPMPFKIISSGIQIDEDRRTGSAETVRRSLEYLSTLTDRTIICSGQLKPDTNLSYKRFAFSHKIGVPNPLVPRRTDPPILQRLSCFSVQS